MFNKKLLREAIITASNNDTAYWISAYSTKANTRDNWMAAALKVQSAKKSAYCLKKCLGEKFISSNVQILFKIRFDVIESIMPNSVAWIYQMFGIKLDNRNDAA